MTEDAAPKINPNGAEPAAPPSFQAAVVPVALFQSIQDILRDQPLPHKLVNPILQAMNQCQVTNVQVQAAPEQGQ